MRVTQRMMVQQLQRNISQSVEHLSELQDQLSSGKRLRRPSDDPQALSQALRYKSTLNQDVQLLRNINSAKGWLSAADTALSQLSSVLERARDIALRGSTDTLGAEERQRLAGLVDSLLGEGLQAANTTHEDYYIFAGRQVATKPFPNPDSYSGDSGLMYREIERGVQVAVNLPGDVQVDGVAVLPTALQSLRDLRDHLTGNDVPGINADLDSITASIGRILDLRGQMGATANRVDATEQSLNTEQVNVTVLLSRAQDADVAEVMTKLMNQESVYRAALAAGARVIQPSLLDFLR